MIRWRVIVTGAASAGALAVAGCGSGQPAASSSSPAPAVSSTATATASPAPKPSATPSRVSGPAVTAAVSLQSSEQVAWTGESVTLTVQASASARPGSAPGSVSWLRLASATLNLGDGASATVTGRCTGASLPSPGAGLQVRHTYRAPGAIRPQVTAAAVCGQHGRPDLSGSAAALRVLPSAPAASTSWPQCGPSQLTISATGTGAGLGHIGVLFALKNSAATGCRLSGYPGLLLLGSHGQALPTTVVRAVNGAYLFPPVVPHWVALAPGESGSFDLQYADNPVGAQATEPYAEACPAATHAEVTLPNASNHTVVPVNMAPCGGRVIVSPVVPGTQWLAP